VAGRGRLQGFAPVHWPHSDAMQAHTVKLRTSMSADSLSHLGLALEKELPRLDGVDADTRLEIAQPQCA
jgi:hypothetical protein